MREEKLVRLCACVIVEITIISDACLLADKRMREGGDSGTPSQAATVARGRDAGPMLGLVCMPMSASAPSAAYSVAGKSMKVVWRWLMNSTNGGLVPSTLSKQHKALVSLIDSWYRPLALPEEIEMLKKSTSDEGECLRIVDAIDMLVAQQLKVGERASVRACEKQTSSAT